MRMGFPALVILPPLLFAAVSYGRFANSSTASMQTAEIPSPSSWVPFSAQSEKTTARDRIIGSFYRASDGSTRSESTLEGQSWRRITIMNVATVTYFEQDRAGRWCSHPMRIHPKGHLPKKMRVTNPTISSVAEKPEGLTVYRMAGPSKVIQFVAPQLNFFPLILEEPLSGTRQRYYNIQIGEQHPELFLPPAGVDVASHSDLMGIVHLGPNDPEPKLSDLRRHQ
jgi:hypothetical protein